MAFGTYRELFAATAAAAGALTGLLFVALSVAPGRRRAFEHLAIQQVRVSAALLAFVNALAISLYSLVPGTRAGYPAAVMGVIGLLFTAAAIRTIRSSQATPRQQRQQVGLVVLLVLIFGAELAGGVASLANPRSVTPLEVISYAVVTSLIVGIERAWELVGDRDTGIVASLAVLTGRQPGGPGGSGPAAPRHPASAGPTDTSDAPVTRPPGAAEATPDAPQADAGGS